MPSRRQSEADVSKIQQKSKHPVKLAYSMIVERVKEKLWSTLRLEPLEEH